MKRSGSWGVGGAALAASLILWSSAGLSGQSGLESGGHVERDHASEVVVLEAVELTEEIEVDGRLTEDAWRNAPAIDQFIQSEPVEGARPQTRTVVRVLYDDQAIYIGARMYEPDPSRIARQLVRRGETGQADYFEVMFDPNMDRRTGYLFRVSAAGVQRDAYLHQDSREDGSWDAVWASDVHIDSLGWSVEMRIPWSQIRYEPSDEPQTWGVNFARWRVAAGELTYHALIPRNQHGRVSFFRPMTGIQAPRHVRRVELRPYVLARGQTGPAEPGDPFFSGREADANAGVDIRYGLGTAFTLDATINPDFGQVEVDPAVINLTAFETFYSERRPFFVEDARIFDFGTSGRRSQLFYSRRIGRAPQGRAPSGVTHAQFPDGTTILGAGKLTGRTAGGLSVGALASVTGAAEGRAYFDETGAVETFAAEPRSYHAVFRARQDFRQGASTLGGIITGIRRDLPADGSLDFLAADAYTGGIDFEHQWADRSWALDGFITGSLVRGDSTALIRIQRSPNHYWQRPDSRHAVDSTRTSLAGANWRLALNRRAAGNWSGNLAVGQLRRGFEINDLGYSMTREHIETNASVTYREIEPGSLFREYRIRASTFQNFGPRALDDFFGLDAWRDARQSGSFWLDVNYTLNNFWGGFAEIAYRPPAYDETATRGGPLLYSPSSRRLAARINSDRRQPFSLSTSADYQWGNAFAVFETGIDLSWRPAPRFELTTGPELTVRSTGEQYVSAFDDPEFSDTYGRRYLFGDLERRTLAMPTRMAVTFTRDLTLQLFAQPLLDAGRYETYKQLAAPSTFDFISFEPGQPADHSGDGQIDGCTNGQICFHEGRQYVDATGNGRADHAFVDRDFNVVSLRGNAVLRWEYRPGSTLFLVWQQQRFEQRPFGDFDPGRDYRDVLSVQPNNVFIVKMNYWLGA